MNRFKKKGGSSRRQMREQAQQQAYQQQQALAQQRKFREEDQARIAATEEKDRKARDEAVVAEKVKIQTKRGISRTIATSALGVLGAAPINKPELRGTLGTRY